MGVITISREPCSGGSQIAEGVASELGWSVAHKKTIEDVLVQYGFVGLKDAYDSMPNFWSRFDDETKRVVEMFDRVVKAMARTGNVVIMGRGAFRVLAGCRDVLHVRIKASFAQRVSTFMKRYGTYDREYAESAIRDADRLRATYLELHYGAKADSAQGFDLVIDTGKISPAAAVPLIVGASRSMIFSSPLDAESSASIEVDKVLLSAVSRVLE